MNRRGRITAGWVGAAVAAWGGIIAIQGCDTGDDPAVVTTTRTVRVAATVTSSVAPYFNPAPTTAARTTTPAGPATTIRREGTYLVGSDIQAGTWRTNGGSYCYWERLSGLTGTFDAIIANGSSEGPQIVEVLPSDRAFKVQGCGSWTLVPG